MALLLRSLVFGRPKSSILSSEQLRNGVLIHVLVIHIVYLRAGAFGIHESNIQCLFTTVLFVCCETSSVARMQPFVRQPRAFTQECRAHTRTLRHRNTEVGGKLRAFNRVRHCQD